MKKIFFWWILIPALFIQCSKSDVSNNQIPGKYFSLGEGYVDFPNDAYLHVDEEGTVTIGSISQQISESGSPCINILISQGDYSLANNTLSFASKADLKLIFFSQREDMIFGNKRVNVSASIKGSINCESGSSFFSDEGTYKGSVSFILTTEDKERFDLLFNQFLIGTIWSSFLDPDARCEYQKP